MNLPPWADTPVPDQATLDRLLSKTKGQLFLHKGAGFLTSLMCDTKFIWDSTVPTAYTTGTQIGWNPQFFMWCEPEDRVTILAHELWHDGFDHIFRFMNMGPEECPDIWNDAADFVINLLLKDHGYTFSEKLMSIEPRLDEQYRDMTTEHVYSLLPKPPKGKPNSQDPNSSGQTPPSQDGGFFYDLRKPDKVTPAGSDEAKKQRHKQLSKLVKAKQASQMAKEAGIIPGEIEMVIDQFLKPIVPWELHLQQWFTEMSREDYSFARPNRRFDDIYLPSFMGDTGLDELNFYIDISGSITDAQVLRFNSEVKHVHNVFSPKLLNVITFDDEIQDIYQFTDDDDFSKIVIHGRGGTDLDPVRRHILKTRPSGAIIFSDLYVTPMTQDPKVPILWVVVGNTRAKPAFGQTIYIPEEQS